MKSKFFALGLAFFLFIPIFRTKTNVIRAQSSVGERNESADGEPNSSVRDEAYQRRPESQDVHAERMKAGLVIGLLVCGPLALFAVSGLADRRSRN